MADPALQRQVARLRRTWAKLGHVERGLHLRRLADAGCSTRGIAEAIGVSATTVRRFLEIASLPDYERENVANGVSAKKVLSARASGRRHRRTLQRLAIEKESGKLSDELSDIVIGFAKGELGDFRTTPDELPLFLNAVGREVKSQDALHVKRERVSKRLALKDQLKAVRPKRPKNDHPIEERAEWLARFVRARFSEPVIWERALEKSAKREKELVPLRTLADTVRSKSWGPTFIVIPPRPITRPAREVMKRQGRKPAEN
ncbi:MAG TPA: hypothetical protein VN622_04080 [Clostridia bacterium]|nr:hypothetical protein [Clostridia bacterium]